MKITIVLQSGEYTAIRNRLVSVAIIVNITTREERLVWIQIIIYYNLYILYVRNLQFSCDKTLARMSEFTKMRRCQWSQTSQVSGIPTRNA